MDNLRSLADRIKIEYETSVRNCAWGDNVADVLKRKILEISDRAYFDVCRAGGTVSCTPVEQDKVSSYNISNMPNVHSEIDKIASDLADIEKYLNDFKV